MVFKEANNRYQKVYESKDLTEEQTKEILSIQTVDLDVIESLFANTAEGPAPYNPPDRFVLPKNTFYNDDKITTTVGRFIINKVLLSENTGKYVGYINRVMDSKGIGWLDGTMSKLLLHDYISVQDMSDFIDRIQWLGFSTAKFINASLTTSLVTTLPDVAKRRSELLDQYKDEVNNADLETVGNIENELLAIAKEELKDDPAMEIYNSGGRGSFNNNYKQVAVMRGSVKNYANPDKVEVSTSNLSDGIDPEELHLFGDLITSASAGRALGTRVGGYDAKKLAASFQNVILDKPTSDCGTKKFEKVEITNANKKLFANRYIKKGSDLELLTEDTIGSYVGRIVEMRSPMYCIGDKYCNKCAGELYYKLGIENVGLISSIIANALVTLSMKSFHDMSIKLEKIEIVRYIQ